MKTLLLASALALAAAGHAEAAPIYTPQTPTSWYYGSWTCTIAHAPNLKLFMTLGPRSARAAVREYPYYGKTEYRTLLRSGAPTMTSVTFHGPSGYLSLRHSSRSVITGAGRIGTTLMLLTCAKS